MLFITNIKLEKNPVIHIIFNVHYFSHKHGLFQTRNLHFPKLRHSLKYQIKSYHNITQTINYEPIIVKYKNQSDKIFYFDCIINKTKSKC